MAINQEIQRIIPYTRKVEAIKGLRKQHRYKYIKERAEIREAERARELDQSIRNAQEEEASLPTQDSPEKVLEKWLQEARAENENRMDSNLRRAISMALDRQSPMEALQDWLESIPLEESTEATSNAVNVNREVRKEKKPSSRRQEKQANYKRIQQLWKKNMSKAAHIVLDGDTDATAQPSLQQQEEFWRQIMEGASESSTDDYQDEDRLPGEHRGLWLPTTEDEIKKLKPDNGTAPGPDGMTTAAWNRVDLYSKRIFFNVLMYIQECPGIILDSRTVLIPKEPGTMDPACFRPLSIASVALRHLHKIMANRMGERGLLDIRQRAFIVADGVAENSSLLSAMIKEARLRMKGLYIAILDVKKAFDSVHHSAILRAMKK